MRHWKVEETFIFWWEKKCNLDSPDGFQRYWQCYDPTVDVFYEAQWRRVQWENGASGCAGASNGGLHWASLLTEGPHLCSNDWVFQQDDSAVHNACLTKDFFQENYVALLDHPACSVRGLFLGYALKLLISWWTACLRLNTVSTLYLLSLTPVSSFGILKQYLQPVNDSPEWNANTSNVSPSLTVLFRSVLFNWNIK